MDVARAAREETTAKADEPTLRQLMLCVLDDPKLTPDEKQELIDELRKASPPKHDRWPYRNTIWFLGAAVLLTILFLFLISSAEAEIPEALVAIGSAAVGALAGLLAPTSGSSDDQ